MSETLSKIIVGGVTNIKVAAYGGVEGGAVDVGFTNDGVVVNNAREYVDIKVDQVAGTIGKQVSDRKMIITLNVSETTLVNLQQAMDLPAGHVAGTVLTMDADVTQNYYTIYLNGIGVTGGTIKHVLHRCVFIGSAERTYAIDGTRMIAVEIEVLPDVSNSNEFGTYTQTGADTTPPTIAMTTPAEDGTVGAASSDTVTLTITEAGSNIDEGSVVYGDNDDATVLINNVEAEAETVLKAGTIVFNQVAKTIVFTPDVVWEAAGENFQVIVTTGLKDDAGNRMAATFYGHFVTV